MQVSSLLLSSYLLIFYLEHQLCFRIEFSECCKANSTKFPGKIYRNITEWSLSNIPSCSKRKVEDIQIYYCDQIKDCSWVF